MAFLEDTTYLAQLTAKEDAAMLENTNYLNQFYKRINDFEQSTEDPSIKNFLELINLELEAGQTGNLEQNLDEGPDALKVMTVHAAKGLEFKYVGLSVWLTAVFRPMTGRIRSVTGKID
jgi:ATP-dependent exoDNAse (exonuclease V) beta subunit